MDKPSILIAEDDSVLREVYSKKFTLAGYDIRTVTNGEEAINSILERQPDISIIDLNMPVLDGFSVLEKFPRDKRDFPILVLTNFGNAQNKERAIKLGADEYFVKNEMTIKSLLEMVENLMKTKKIWNK